MKVLFIQKTLLGGSSAADSEYLPATVARLGHKALTFARAGGNSAFQENAGVRTVEIPSGESWLGMLKKHVTPFQPDIIHVFFHRGCGFYPYWLKSVTAAKFVLDIRSPLLRLGFMKGLIKFKNRFEAFAYDVITAHGIESAWTVVGKRPGIYFVPPGVDHALIPHRTTSQKSGDTLRLVYIGSLHPLRQVPDIIKAVFSLRKKLPNIKLDIYGEGQDKKQISKIIDNEYGHDTVRLWELVPREELLQQLLDYDIGISYIPKKLYDPAIPLKTIEYLALGLPTIATNTLGNRYLIKHLESGYLIEDSPDALADAIMKMAGDPALRQKLARNARKSVEAYDWKNIVRQKLIPVYEQLIGQR